MGLYLVESFKAANLFSKLAFIFLLIDMFVGWIAYCTANWGRYYPYANTDVYGGYGVWKAATNNDPRDLRNPSVANPVTLGPPAIVETDGWLLEWYGAFQAFATFGFICLNVGFFLMVLHMFVTPCGKNNSDLAFWNGINNIVGSICWLVAFCLFAAEFGKEFDTPNKESSLHYSFGFAIIAFILQLAAGIVLLLTTSGRVGSK